MRKKCVVDEPVKAATERVTPKRELTFYDSTSLIVGVIVGVGIYQMAPDVAKGAMSWWGVLLLWAIGGGIALCGALGYAELASMYPREGGDYVFLTQAYGGWAGFLFGWAQMAIVRPGDIAVLAFAFATYANVLLPPAQAVDPRHSEIVYAVAAVAALTAINIMGVKRAKWTQNVLTAVKITGLLLIFGIAFLSTPGEASTVSAAPLPVGLALIFVLFTYGGWNEMAYAAAEIRNPSRTIVRALVAGLAIVTVLYVLTNAAFLYALGYSGLSNSKAVAADSVASTFPQHGAAMISALICISALGAVNGLIFTGARISYAVGVDHNVFHRLGNWHERLGTPVPALILQAAIAILLIVLFGSFVDTLLYTAPAVYAFYLATSCAVLVLRRKAPGVPRPYRVTAYPVPTLLFCVACCFLLYSVVTYRPLSTFATFAVLLLGLPVYHYSRSRQNARRS